MKTKLGLLLLTLLIAVGCDDSAPIEQPVKSITNTIGMKLNLIPEGNFLMGSPETEEDRDDDEKQHKVTIAKAFYIQTTEVTQEQWKAVTGTEPWRGKGKVKEGPDHAATYVTWNDAIAYCKKLSEIEDKKYRLPTEAEWEYACRAGTNTRWSFGNDDALLGQYAWYDNLRDIGDSYAHQVGLKEPNPFGLYDMHGNVNELCHDYYYKQSPEKGPVGQPPGSYRVSRGGSWNFHSRRTRSAVRVCFFAAGRTSVHGFRLVRELD